MSDAGGATLLGARSAPTPPRDSRPPRLRRMRMKAALEGRAGLSQLLGGLHAQSSSRRGGNAVPIIIIKECAIAMVAATPPLSARKKRMGKILGERVDALEVWVVQGGETSGAGLQEVLLRPCRWQTAERTSPPIPSAGCACAVYAPASVT
ncbi:hypothetical protein MTO96_023635 [Rhipicephalus appendiculatus]